MEQKGGQARISSEIERNSTLMDLRNNLPINSKRPLESYRLAANSLCGNVRRRRFVSNPFWR